MEIQIFHLKTIGIVVFFVIEKFHGISVFIETSFSRTLFVCILWNSIIQTENKRQIYDIKI